jgi:hypothetical protein
MSAQPIYLSGLEAAVRIVRALDKIELEANDGFYVEGELTVKCDGFQIGRIVNCEDLWGFVADYKEDDQ